MPVRVLHLSTYAHGGAGRAATSLHQAMVEHGIQSRLLNASGLRFRVARLFERRLPELQKSPWRTWRSVGRFTSLTADEINACDADIVHLHWITDGFLSVEQIARITKPLVWTMHDMWPLTGTEHYGPEGPGVTRWQQGYTRTNRPASESGPDLDRWTWERKLHNWTRPIHLVPVSRWLSGAVTTSRLASAWPASVIPNVMDVSTFSPGSRQAARASLGLPDTPVIAFVSAAGVSDERKGWHLLRDAMPKVRQVLPEARVMVIGRGSAEAESQLPSDVLRMGHVADNRQMATLLRAADVIAVPSTADNLPMAACEAQCTGRAVVGFQLGGLGDTVEHLVSGYLAQPFDLDDYAKGLALSIEDSRASNAWGEAARERAVSRWAPDEVVKAYLTMYEQVVA